MRVLLRRRSSAWTALVMAALYSTAHGQFVEDDVEVIYRIAGESAGDNFGLELCAVADYNADGAREFLVSAPGSDDGAVNAGKIYLFDGRTGALLRSHTASRPGAGLRNVCSAGDVDGDGIPDYLYGSGDDHVSVRSGADGTELHHFVGTAGEAFGFRACGVGDLDGDGRGDLLIGAWSNDNVATNAGKAYLISGATGFVIREHAGDIANAQFGHTVARLGDLDLDGVDDYSVGAPGPFSAAQRGRLFVYSGATGLELRAPHAAPPSGRIFGAWVPSFGAHDLTGDEVPEYTVTDLGDPGTSRGRLFVYDGATGNEVYNVLGFSTQSGFGGIPPNPESDLGDVNGDGVTDLVVGSWESDVGALNGGQVDILSGIDGSRLRTITSNRAGVNLAGSAAGVGTVDLDGIPDFAIGANGDSASTGVVYLIRSRDHRPASVDAASRWSLLLLACLLALAGFACLRRLGSE